ncbi:Small GTPase [Trypanosoma melophagium]|uniref:Small GTPase n=1 Tax=Trypanosoma melophagium TaxID=715481 RepID=UPI00351AA597|nr:Small GTPase [Trypanosoma melophagium]
MEDVSEVDVFLEKHHLSQYKYVLRAEGYEDHDDLCILVYSRGNSDMFCKLVPKSGHRTKLERLLHTIAQQSRASSSTSVAVVAWEKRKQKESLLSNEIINSPDVKTATEVEDDALGCCDKLLSVKCVHQTLQSDRHHNHSHYLSSSLLSQPPPEIVLKILVVGQRGCGKTSFIERFVHGSFSKTTRVTLGADFSEKRMEFNSLVLRLQFWDVSGQEYSTTVTRAYYKNSCAAIVMYDAKDHDSLEKAAEWKADIDSKFTFPNIPLPIPSILTGNKYDYYSSYRMSFSNYTHESKSIMHGTNDTMLSENNMTATSSLTGNEKPVLNFPQEIQEFCNRHHFVGHFFASAKKGYGILNAMEFLVTAVDKMAPFSFTLDEHQNRLLNFSCPDNSMRSIQVPRGRSISSSSSSLARGTRVRLQPEVKKRTCCIN